MRAIFSTSNPNGTYLCLEDIGGALAICTSTGELLGATPSARELLTGLGIPVQALPSPLPATLWQELSAAPCGQATEWRPTADAGRECLGCTRYPLGETHMLLLMREVSDKKQALLQRLHQQRLEATGRLVATIAHDLREPLASIVYNVDVLSGGSGGRKLPAHVEQEIFTSIRSASDQLRGAIDGLLDFARLGPPVVADVYLPLVVDRVLGLLRPRFRDGGHTVTSEVDERTPSLRGNPLIVEQILLNLVLNAVEAAHEAAKVHIRVEPGAGTDLAGFVRIFVEDEGPGVPPELRARVFDPFFTTKTKGTGLGLTVAREAAVDLGGDLLLGSSERGASFEVRLPLHAGRSSAPGAT